MNINNSRLNVKNEALNLNSVNNLQNEVKKTLGNTDGITAEQANAVEKALTPEMKQLILNCGTKMNFVAINDSFEKSGNIKTEDSDEPQCAKTAKNPTSGCQGKGWEIFKKIFKAVASFIGWMACPIGMAIYSGINILRNILK